MRSVHWVRAWPIPAAWRVRCRAHAHIYGDTLISRKLRASHIVSRMVVPRVTEARAIRHCRLPLQSLPQHPLLTASRAATIRARSGASASLRPEMISLRCRSWMLSRGAKTSMNSYMAIFMVACLARLISSTEKRYSDLDSGLIFFGGGAGSRGGAAWPSHGLFDTCRADPV